MQLFATVLGLVRLHTLYRILRISATNKRPPDLARPQRTDGSHLPILLVYRRGIMIREWPERTLSFPRLLLPILSPWLPSRLLRVRLLQLPNARHGRNRD